jgi:hypothetical protein
MQLTRLSLLTLLVVSLTACSAAAHHHAALVKHLTPTVDKDDPISGEWSVTFYVKDHPPTPAKFTLKLDGDKVTGTAYSDHTGEGTLREGKWENGKLSFTLEFKKHEAIVVTGAMKENKLVGEFSTEGFSSNWEATRK